MGYFSWNISKKIIILKTGHLVIFSPRETEVKNLIRFLICILVVFFSGDVWGQGASQGVYVAGEVLVKFKGGATDLYAKSLLNQIKARQIQDFPFINVQRLKVPDSKKLPEYLELLRSDPQVEYAEPNYIIKAYRTPNDPDFSKLWGLHNTGQTGGTADADIDAPEAWDSQTGSSNTIIAVIDSGVNYDHEDLTNNIWSNPGETPNNGKDDDGNGLIDDIRGWDFVNNDNDPLDDNGHGTHVAGIIAAVGNNSKGVAGVNWSAKIMSLKFLDKDGSGNTADAISAIQYAIDNGAKVLNSSWGSTDFSQALRDAIIATHNAGTLFVAAAGNDNKDNDVNPEYPASYKVPNIVSVAATTHKDTLASFSNYGATTVHAAAPGESIYSTSFLNSYQYLSGTSQATPYVSGLAGLIWSSPNLSSLTNKEVKYNIMATSDPLNSLASRVLSRGRINAYKALTCSDNTLALFNNSFGENFSFEANRTVQIKVTLTAQCGAAVPQATVNTIFSNGDEGLVLYDDGKHSDDSAGDGVYANSWTPLNPTATTLTITAARAGFTDTSLSQTGTVAQNYSYNDTVTFNWIDASSGIDTGIKEDDGSAIVDIGFNFSFYGNTYSRVRIDSNGYLSFDLQNDPENDYQNGTMPDPSLPNDIIGPFWTDLDASHQGTIFYLLSGTAPNRVFTAEWRQLPHVAGIVDNKTVDTPGDATFEVSLYEATGEIVFRYQDVSFDDFQFDQGRSATVGIENSTGQIGRLYSFKSPSLKNQLAIRFYVPETTPTAKAGSDRVVPTGSPVMLDGTGSSDPGDRVLSYTWSLVAKPAGSTAAIADSKKATTSFKPDADGVYMARLVVNNSQKQSPPDTITIRAVGSSNTKIQVISNKSYYKAGDLLELYLWVGNGVSEPVIKADAFIGFGFPDGRLFFFDASGNLKEGDPANPRSFTPIAQNISLPAVWVFPEPADMDADSDGNGKLDAYRLLSARLPQLPPGEYFAFAALAQPGTTQAEAGSPAVIGQISLAFFAFSD